VVALITVLGGCSHHSSGWLLSSQFWVVALITVLSGCSHHSSGWLLSSQFWVVALITVLIPAADTFSFRTRRLTQVPPPRFHSSVLWRNLHLHVRFCISRSTRHQKLIHVLISTSRAPEDIIRCQSRAQPLQRYFIFSRAFFLDASRRYHCWHVRLGPGHTPGS
jgi:hypothetical protein